MRKLLDDTLFKRLFLLMWMALVVSHLAGFLTLQQFLPPPDGGPRISGVPPLPSLPPLGGHAIGGPDGGPPDGDMPDGRPIDNWLWVDFLVRGLVIGVAAWFGARWLSAPMHQLADASRALGQSLGLRRPVPVLSEAQGTLEVRQTAEVFNAMSRRLHEQFSAQALLMAAISHDLRTPLSRLRLRLEHMAPGAHTERCINDVREMDQLIASVLEMMQLNHEPAAPQRVDLRALVQSLADDMAEQGQAVTLHSSADEAEPAVVPGQPAALNRIIDNLLSNALRYGGSAEISVNLQPEQRQVQVLIDDRGPGIPAEQLDAVFQPFYRVDTSRSKQTGGSGLGLYIARDLARRHGGQVLLANRHGGGLRAELLLPLHETKGSPRAA
jgi:signal transduction histidine kinase